MRNQWTGLDTLNLDYYYFFHVSKKKKRLINFFITYSGEQGMVDEAQKLLEEAEALKKVLYFLFLFIRSTCFFLQKWSKF